MMIRFELKQSSSYRAVKLEGFFRLIKFLHRLFLLGALISLLSLNPQNPSLQGNPGLLFLNLFILGKILVSFFNSKLKNLSPQQGIEKAILTQEETNLAQFFDFETTKAFVRSIRSSGSEDPGSTVLFYFLLKDNPSLKFIFSRVLLDFQEIKKKLKELVENDQEKDFEKIVLAALEIAKKRNRRLVNKGDLLISLAENNSVFGQILIENDLHLQDIQNLVWWLENLQEKKKRRFWEYENLLKLGSLGQSWATGYTVTLDQFSADWTEAIEKRGGQKVIGHEEEIAKIELILAGDLQNAALLIGETGSGKKSIIHALANKTLFGQSLASLNHKRVVELDLIRLSAQAKNQENVNSLLETIFQEVIKVKNIILVIRNLSDFVGRGEKSIDVSGLLSKYLSFPQVRLIATCNPPGFRRNIETNSHLLALLEKVIVKEISERETILILETLVPFYEKKYKVFISYHVLRDVIKYCTKYLTDFPFPKKAINLLAESVVYVARHTKDKVVLSSHIAQIVSEKTKIPVGKIKAGEKDILLNLESLIHQQIINQERAVKEISTAMRRARAEITIRKGPIGAFLFLGPTGVGKTESSKVLAEIYFGDRKRMIRLDMSEFQNKEDIPRLIGSAKQDGLLTTKAKEAPFSLILLDEIEKAHPDILNLFLQVIDEGHITDGLGRRIDFRNCIIIATSNAGYKVILKALEENLHWSRVRKQLLDYLFEQAIFRPEFINRFDAVVIFKPLSKQNLLDIVQLMLKSLRKNLEAKYIEFEITEELKEKIVELGYNPIFGAREIRRVIQDRVENVLAEALLADEIKRGDKIKIGRDFEIIKLN